MTVLLVEQSVPMALRICSRGYVIKNGEIVLADTAGELAKLDLSQAYFDERSLGDMAHPQRWHADSGSAT
jgi:ABC-type branched-subunit amino acid transport system ATPase component